MRVGSYVCEKLVVGKRVNIKMIIKQTIII